MKIIAKYMNYTVLCNAISKFLYVVIIEKRNFRLIHYCNKSMIKKL